MPLQRVAFENHLESVIGSEWALCDTYASWAVMATCEFLCAIWDAGGDL